jgi:phosphoglycerol transferase MdoB-like AlkP superfamily enzyme
MFYALKFDLSSIIYVNVLLIIGMLFPIPSRRQPLYQRILKIIFVATNGVALIFELIDVVYFPFNLRRIIYSDFALFQNTAEMIPGLLLAYWWLCLIWISLLIILSCLFRKTCARHPEAYRTHWQIFIFLVSLALLGIGARGGLQLRPVSPITAFEYIDNVRLTPLITNTTMSLLFSSQADQLTEKNYFNPARTEEIFNLRRQYHDTPPPEKRNVFIIVLESFGVEHVGPNTPFLDSLLKRSLIVKEAYSNGLRSTQGILAITASIPVLMDKPLMFSAYQTNRIDGLAKVLGEWGYTSGFFHGANPGSMEFERFAKLSGFDHYIDRNDFDDDNQYDGRWGIWDKPFFEFTASEVSKYPEPFFTLLFSLTSHHPYHVPDWFANEHPEEDPQIRANRYTDYALRSFFNKIKKESWFQNTLFVITADHTGKSDQAFYQGNQGRYRIPIAIYDPRQDVKGSIKEVGQQTDIMPTVLDLIGYDQKFAAFGNSLLDSTRTPMVYHFNGIWYHAINQSYFYEFDGFTPQRVFNYRKDPALKESLLGSESVPLGFIDTLKAIIQVHNDAMLNNQLYLPEED